MPQTDDAEYLLSQARRCRQLAQANADERMRETLLGMAREYEERADRAKAAKR